MKNRYFTIIAFYSIIILLLLSTYAHAQTTQYHNIPQSHYQGTAMASAYKHNTAKTTGAQSRLIAECNLIYSDTAFFPTDSTRYYYSGDRGGEVGHLIKYDSATDYNHTTGTYVNGALEIQTFDVNNNIITTLVQYWDPTTNSYINANIYTNTYDNNNNQITTIIQSWNATNNAWVNADSDRYAYNGNNNVIEETYYTWNATTASWTGFGHSILTYTSANEISSETDQSWNVSAWINANRDSFTYDNNNNELSDLNQTWDATNNGWVNATVDSFTYDAGNNRLTQLSKNWASGAWVNFILYTYSNFIDHLPEIEISQSRDAADTAWINAYKYLSTYNSYDELTTSTTETWSGSDWQPINGNRQSRYYYEVYNLAVKPVSNAGGSARIYPVPAQDMLHIDLTWDAPQPCSIAIYDVQGRMLKHWQVPAVTEYHNTIPVNDFAAGNYFINITGVKGQIVQKLVVSK